MISNTVYCAVTIEAIRLSGISINGVQVGFAFVSLDSSICYYKLTQSNRFNLGQSYNLPSLVNT